MATITGTRSGGGFLGFAAVILPLAAVAVLLGSLAMPTMQVAETNDVVEQAKTAKWTKEEIAKRRAEEKVMLEEARAEHKKGFVPSNAPWQVRTKYGVVAAKAPADMNEQELRAELDTSQEIVAEAWDAVVLGDQAARDAAIAARAAANERYIAADEEAIKRGWYVRVYADAELAEIAAGVKTGTITFEIMSIPGIGTVPVADDHIVEGHGAKAMSELKKGGFSKSPCDGGHKTYWYKDAIKRGFCTIAIMWDGIIVTTYDVTMELLLYYLRQDGCPPPPSLGHDMLSGPAY